VAVACSLTLTLAVAAPPSLRIVSPDAESAVSGRTRVEVEIDRPDEVRSVSISVNGRLLCTLEHAPFECTWDAGPVFRGHHVRVVAVLNDGSRLVRNVRTKDLGYTERARTEAVLVPVIVTRDGEFVRGLKQRDFQILEDGVPQSLASFVSEDAPLDLLLAVDISSSMEHSLADVKLALKRLLSRLRPDDAATVIGFNDTTFVVAERESNPRVREDAVELLASWGGTALYDATVRTLDLVSKNWGRKGVVIFSDGDDRHSLVSRDTALARVQASDAMLYTIGFGGGAVVPRLRESLETYARATGGRAYFPKGLETLDGVFDEIVTELANQYVLSYSSTNSRQDGKWRDIKVQVRGGQYEVRARRGYRATSALQAQR
jgi:Ca-activated chloride channel family protein